MAGCIYIPTFDHTLLSGTKRDFRGWANQHQSLKAEQLRTITRPQIESMFGKPLFASRSGTCVAYVMGSEHGIWVWPLCFGGGFDKGNTQVLKLVYDDRSRLKKVIPLVESRVPPLYWFGTNINAPGSDADPIACARYMLRGENQACAPDEVIDLPDLLQATPTRLVPAQ